MPYISEERRQAIDSHGIFEVRTAGELNYLLSMTVIQFLGERPDYQDYNDALGAIEGTKLEIYRRSVAPYEDIKVASNGDLPYPNKIPTGETHDIHRGAGR